MAVEIRSNFAWDRRPPPPDEKIEVHEYSVLVTRVLRRACDIADGHGHYIIRVEHLFEALLKEPDARVRLSELGYADNDAAHARRFQLLSRPVFMAGEVPSEAFGQSDRLTVWLRAAREVAARREGQLQTVVVDDLVIAILGDDLDEQDNDLRSLQPVLAQYRRTPTVSFRAEATRRLDELEERLKDTRRDVLYEVQTVGGKVDEVERQVVGVSAQVAGVSEQVAGISRQIAELREQVGGVDQRVGDLSHQIAEVKLDTTEILADAKALRASLTSQMRFSRLLLAVVILLAVLGGACAGLLVRGLWGGL